MKAKPLVLTTLAAGVITLLLLGRPPVPALDDSPQTDTQCEPDNSERGEPEFRLSLPRYGGPSDQVANPREILNRVLGVSFVDESGEQYDGLVFSKQGDLVTVNSVYRNCRDMEHDFVCSTEDEFDHPYAAYSFDELDAIAEFDAAASFILGYRIFEDPAYRTRFEGDTWYQAGVNHLLNASVLSGARQPYTAMMDHRNLLVLGYVEGKEGWNRLEQIYTWSKAGIELGYLHPAWPGFHAARRFVNDEMSDQAKTILEDLDKKADAIKRYLIEKKARTTG